MKSPPILIAPRPARAISRGAGVVAILLALIAGGDVVHAQPAASLHAEIDRLVEHRWTGQGVVPAAVCDDAEFVRRAHLDLTGMVPTASEVRAFLGDPSSDKRQRLVDQLLARPDYAVHMARVFDVMLIERRIPTISSYDVPSPTWRGYLTQAFAENRPWDRIVREILESDGTGDVNAAGVKFALVRDAGPHLLTRDVGRLFLGIDLQCAQCHDDPRIETYKQADYYGIYAFLQRVTSFRDSKKNVSLLGETAAGKATFVSVFTAKSGETNPRLPGGEMVADPMIEAGKEYVTKPGPNDRGVPAYSRRKKLAELLPRAETHGFSRNIVNRVWAQLMGRGLVHPLDLHHPDNPPSHPELLARMESWFVEQKFDIKTLMREIMQSRAYQRSSILPEGVQESPVDGFAAAKLRGLSPEQFAWSLLQATGRVEEHVARWEAQQKAKSKPATNSPTPPADTPMEATPVWKARLVQLDALDRQARTLSAVFAGLPGQPDGDFQPVVDQALHLLNSPAILALVKDAPLLSRLSEIDTPEPVAEELYLSLLSRRPDAEEVAAVRSVIEAAKTAKERRDALQPLVWGLLLSAEFRLNH
ncbi:MAG: DUF1549 domain-containing protein [Planctomycetaceae bacterium]|nr:DUF1549 domain-containing protein [Planctomycetaceae bacterium]